MKTFILVIFIITISMNINYANGSPRVDAFNKASGAWRSTDVATMRHNLPPLMTDFNKAGQEWAAVSGKKFHSPPPPPPPQPPPPTPKF